MDDSVNDIETQTDPSTGRYEDFYRRLRARLAEWSEGRGRSYRYLRFLLVLPDLFHLVARLAMDPRVGKRDRLALASVAAYVVLPIDLIPEALAGPLGFADDLVVAAAVLSRLVGGIPREVIEEHWSGDRDVLRVIQDILGVAEKMVGRGLWKGLKQLT